MDEPARNKKDGMDQQEALLKDWLKKSEAAGLLTKPKRREILTTWFFERMTLLITEREERERKRWKVSRFRYVLERLARELLEPRDERPYTLFLPFV